MPAVSQSQQRLFGQAYAYKKGKLSTATPEIRRLAESLSKKQLHDFAATKHKGLPKKIASAQPSFMEETLANPISGLSLPSAAMWTGVHRAVNAVGNNLTNVVAPYYKNQYANLTQKPAAVPQPQATPPAVRYAGR